MKKVSVILSLVAIALIINSCKKDFSIYAPGESITIVTGFLDPSQDTQFVKINKTWQGDGNNLEYALIRDSSEYKWDEFNSITIKEIVDGNVMNTYPLSEIEKSDKEDGLFYGPEYTAYYFVNPNEFDADATYRLDIDFVDKSDVWAETQIILESTGSIYNPAPSNPIPARFGSETNGTVSFIAYKPKWYEYTNAGRYSVSLQIHYKEMVWSNLQHTDLISEELKTINWDIGDKDIDDLTGDRYQISAPGQIFYDLLASNMVVDPFITRELGILNDISLDTEALDFTLSIANKDFNDFIEINQPSTSIVQEKPQYTNINNGIGVFASRTTVIVEGVRLNSATYNVIPYLNGLSELNICTPALFTDITCD